MDNKGKNPITYERDPFAASSSRVVHSTPPPPSSTASKVVERPIPLKGNFEIIQGAKKAILLYRETPMAKFRYMKGDDFGFLLNEDTMRYNRVSVMQNKYFDPETQKIITIPSEMQAPNYRRNVMKEYRDDPIRESSRNYPFN